MDLASMRTLELDKICRVCLTVKKDMKPLFGEMVSEMLMECARVQIDNTDGWPDKICIQCVHQVSRCHAFKTKVEKADQQLRQYINGLTVIVEEPLPKEMTIEIQRSDLQPHQIQRAELITSHPIKTEQHGQIHIQQAKIQKSQEIQTQTSMEPHPQQMIITNGQLHNTTAQLINGQILTTSHGQPIIQTGAQIVQAGQIVHQGQLVGSGQNIQLIQQNGQHQFVQIQRADGERCEIIVPHDTQYYEDVQIQEQEQEEEEEQQHHHHHHHHHQEELEIEEQEQELEHEQHLEHTQETIEIQEEEMEEGVTYTLAISDDSDQEDKQYIAEFITLQTSCPSPGRFICNLCHKEFKHNKWLRSHMKQHSNWIKANCKKQPQCEICHRSFKGPGMLKMHMKTHEQKQHICDICNKKFSSNHMLQNHMARHRGEKSHQCQHCPKSFYTPGDLKNHVQHHLGKSKKNQQKHHQTGGTTIVVTTSSAS